MHSCLGILGVWRSGLTLGLFAIFPEPLLNGICEVVEDNIYQIGDFIVYNILSTHQSGFTTRHDTNIFEGQVSLITAHI